MRTQLGLGLIVASLGAAATGARAAAADGGFMVRVAIHPEIASGSGDTKDTETTKTGDDPEETSTSSSTTDARSTQSVVSLGVGYTFPFYLHVGASVWQESSSLTITEDTSDDDTPPSSYSLEMKSKSTLTAIGPTVGLLHPSGFSLLFTPFMSIASKDEDTTTFTDDSGDEPDPEPTVTDDSKTSGYRIDVGWHARVGGLGIGPVLSYTSLTTKVDVTTVDSRERFDGDVETTTTHTTGTSRVTRLVPMIGVSLFL